MEMKGIDLTKCNNLRYRAKVDGNNDYGRICVENADTGLAFLRSDLENGYVATWHCDVPTIEGICGRKVTDFEIVPRGPETYKDWQVGDIIVNRDGCTGRIIFRSGDFVAANIGGCMCYTCEEMHGSGWRLVLTDIEQQIIEEKKPKLYEFKAGEPVLVKNGENAWRIAVFLRKRDTVGDFEVMFGNGCGYFNSCLPYKEKTMHLLGTAEDYKEE